MILNDEILKTILRDITISEIIESELDEKSLIYLSYRNSISKLMIKCYKENLYFIDDNNEVRFMLSIDNVLYIGIKHIDKLREVFNSTEINYITLYIFNNLTSLSIDGILDIGLSFKSDLHTDLNNLKSTPLIYYKNEEVFYENMGHTTSYFFYDDYTSNYTGDFIDLNKFRTK